MNGDKALTKQKKHSQRVKNKIYDSAMLMINKFGYDSVTINDICKEADISVGSFYHHYSSKDDILFNCSQDEALRISDVLDDLQNETHAVRFKSLCINRVTMGTISKSLDLSINISIAHLKNYSKDQTFSTNGEMYKALLNEIVEGQKSCEFRNDIDISFLIESVLYYISGIIMAWQFSAGTLEPVEKVSRFIDLLLNSIVVK